MASERAEAARARLGTMEIESSATWTPEKLGDQIIGQVVEVKSPETKYGRRMAIIVNAEICVQNGIPQKEQLYTVWQRAQLKILWYRHRICVGDFVVIEYAEDGAAKKGGNPAKLFKFENEKTDESQPWVDPEADVPKPPAESPVSNKEDVY